MIVILNRIVKWKKVWDRRKNKIVDNCEMELKHTNPKGKIVLTSKWNYVQPLFLFKLLKLSS